MSIKVSKQPGEAGFSLMEMMVTLTVTTVVMGGALGAFMNANQLNALSTETLTTNRELATAVDFLVRDFTQVAQGLPTTKVLTIPSGGVVVNRPSPVGSNLTFAAGTTSWPAVLPGPGLGPRIAAAGPRTDMVSMVYVDTNFGTDLPATLAANGGSMTATAPTGFEVGDVILFKGASATAVQSVTAVTGDPGTLQTVTFDLGDKLGLNQRAATEGTVLGLGAGPVTVSRVRIVTYYVDAARDPVALVRCLNNQCVGANPDPGQVVALGVESFQLSYDLMDGDTNPANVKMDATDLAGGGACGVDACSPGQVRKANLYLALRSRHTLPQRQGFVHRSLSTQISLRNLSFVDRYPDQDSTNP